MAEIQQGSLAMIFGAPSLGLKMNGGATFNFTSTTAIVLTEVSHTRMAKTVETQNAAGNTVNVTTYDVGDEVTLTVMPAGATRTDADTVHDLFPRPGGYAALIDGTNVSHLDNATISSTAGGVSGSGTGVVYRINTASKSSSGGGKVTWTLGLQRFDGWSDANYVGF